MMRRTPWSGAIHMAQTRARRAQNAMATARSRSEARQFTGHSEHVLESRAPTSIATLSDNVKDAKVRKNMKRGAGVSTCGFEGSGIDISDE